MNKENKYEDIDIIDIEDYEDVFGLIGNALFQLENDTDYIAVYSKRDLISFLFTEMLKDGYDFGYADFDMLDESLSDRIYLMLIRRDCTISVEPAISKGNVVIGHDAKVAFIDMDECKQNVVDYCVNSNKNVVMFGYSDDEECECDYCDCVGNHVCKESEDKTDISCDKDGLKVTVKCDLDADEALEIIRDMESRMVHINKMFTEMDNFRKLFRW